MNITRQHKITTISGRDEIKFILDNGKKKYTRLGLIFLYKEVDESEFQKAAILLKKNIGSAVKRNYVKRIIRHFLRDYITLFKNYNRVIFLYTYRGDIDYNSLKEIYVRALS